MEIAVGLLLLACAVLYWDVVRLHRKLNALQTFTYGLDSDTARWRFAKESRLREVERLSASNDAALELLDVSVDNHERALRAQENLSILTAHDLTRLDGRIAKIERNPFHVPVRRDN